MQPNTSNVIPFPVKVRAPAQVRFDASGLPVMWIDRVLRTKLAGAAKVMAIRLHLNLVLEPDLERVTPQWLTDKTGEARSTVYRGLAQLKEHRFIDEDLDPIETDEDRLGFDEYLRINGEPPREQFLRESHAKVRAMAASA